MMKRPLNLAWDNSLARRDRAGTGVYAARLLEQLRNREDLRTKVLNGWSRSSSANGVITRGLGTVGNLLWTHALLPGVLWKMRADVVHSPSFIAPVASPCPVVVTVHDVTYLLYPSHFRRWWLTYLKTVMPAVLKTASAIICVSEHSKRDVIRVYGVSADKVKVVHNGVDHERFHPGATLDRHWAKALDIRDGYVLHVGTFSYRKNIPTLLRAIADLRSKGKWGERQVVLAGSQDLSLKGGEEVFKTIRELDLTGNVVLTGHVPEEHIPGLYAHASMLVMSSLYEGFGLPVLEAMAVGTPVVCSDASSLPEVAGDSAIFFPPHDQYALAGAMENLMQNPSIAEQLRRKGFEQARNFTWQRTAEQTIEIYRDVARS